VPSCYTPGFRFIESLDDLVFSTKGIQLFVGISRHMVRCNLMMIRDFPDQCLPAIFPMMPLDMPVFKNFIVYPHFVVIVGDFLGAGTIVVNQDNEHIPFGFR
jgi:hypothetical protein